MNCPCHTAALRIFVKSILRVHTSSSVSRSSRGTRSFQTSSPPIRSGRRDDLRSLAFPAASRRCMSDAAALFDERGSPNDTATEPSTPTPDDGKHDNAGATPAFPKALKAKKKQRKLAANTGDASTLIPENTNSHQAASVPENGEAPNLEAEDFEATTGESPDQTDGRDDKEGSPKDKTVKNRGIRANPAKERIPRRSKEISPEERIPKNRKKREAREAGTYVPGPSAPESTAQEADNPKTKRPPQEPKRLEDRSRPPRTRKLSIDGEHNGLASKTSEDSRRPARETKATSREAKATARETKAPEDATDVPPKPEKEHWQLQKAALKEKFPEGWAPRKRLSPDALAGIRALHQSLPEEYTTEVLAKKFEVSPEAIRRILKSKWEPQPGEEIERQERWFSRGKRIWSAWAEEGKKPPAKWRQEGITRDPSYHEQRRARSLAQRRIAKTLV